MKDEARIPILMTATIKPEAFNFRIQRKDPVLRMKDYKHALLFWLSNEDNRIGPIVFCENSGSDLGELISLAKMYKRPVEFLSYVDEDLPSRDLHYGYSELGIIDYALDNSMYLNQHQNFFKATGRLVFPRFTKMLNCMNQEYDSVVDHRKKLNQKLEKSISRTQLMFFDTSYYKKKLYKSRNEMIGSHSHIESFLAYKFYNHNKEGYNICFRFPVECPPRGVGAGRQADYSSFVNLSKEFLRGICRRSLPFLWL